jgi:hypothetical protein
MPFCGSLRGKLVEAQEQGFSLHGYEILVSVLPSPLIVGPRNLAQGAALRRCRVNFKDFAPV